MGLEKDVREILAQVGETRLDVWGQQAGRISDGLDRSRVVGSIAESVARTDASLASMASVLGVMSGVIVGQLSESNRFLASVADSLRNPLAATADERFRRGVNALQRGWNTDAIEEFEAAVAADRYVASAHAYLAFANLRESRLDAGYKALADAVKYALPDNPQLAIGCALMLAELLEKAGMMKEARAAIDPVLPYAPVCPEIAFTSTRVTKSIEGIDAAISFAPDLAVAAAAGSAPGVAEEASRVANLIDGPVADARDVLSHYTTWPDVTTTLMPLEETAAALNSGDPARELETAAFVLATLPSLSERFAERKAHLTAVAAKRRQSADENIANIHAEERGLTAALSLRTSKNWKVAGSAALFALAIGVPLSAFLFLVRDSSPVTALSNWIVSGLIFGTCLIFLGILTGQGLAGALSERHDAGFAVASHRTALSRLSSKQSGSDTETNEEIEALDRVVRDLARTLSKRTGRIRPWGFS